MSTFSKVASKVTEHVVLPQLGRMGNLSTGTLIGMGISAQHADWLTTGFVGAVLIGLDLVASALMRWAKERTGHGADQSAKQKRVQEPR